jgi:ribosomal protein S20
VIDGGVRKGVFHRNTASRYKSHLTSQANSLLQAK